MDITLKHLLWLWLLFASFAIADHRRAMQAAKDGRVSIAIEELETLAGLGHVESQYQLGLLLSTHTTQDDQERAYAWLLLAKANSHPMASEAYKQLRAKVKNKRNAKRMFNGLAKSFGQDTLTATLLPTLKPEQTAKIWPTSQNYPVLQPMDRNWLKAAKQLYGEIWALVSYDIDWHGKIDALEVLASESEISSDSPLLQAILSQRFTPRLNERAEPIYTYAVTQWVSTHPDSKPSDTQLSALQQSANQGDGKALRALASLKQELPGNNQYSSFETMLAAAQAGDSRAQWLMADCLFAGQTCVKDNEKALRWLKAAASSGHMQAQLLIAEKAGHIDRVRRLAQQGHAPALSFYISKLAQEHSVARRLLAYKLISQATLHFNDTPHVFVLAGQLAKQHNDEVTSQIYFNKASLLAERWRYPKAYHQRWLDGR